MRFIFELSKAIVHSDRSQKRGKVGEIRSSDPYSTLVSAKPRPSHVVLYCTEAGTHSVQVCVWSLCTMLRLRGKGGRWGGVGGLRMTKCRPSLILSPHTTLKCFIVRGIIFDVHLRTSHAKMDPHFYHPKIRYRSHTHFQMSLIIAARRIKYMLSFFYACMFFF